MLVSPLKVVFAGTPEFAAAHLQSLVDSKHQVCAVYTQPDRPAGRGRKLMASAVKQLAHQNNLLVCQPESLKSTEARALLRSFEADIMVVVAYGIILPKEILQIPRLGCINVHASLLPRWRGAAPIHRAIEAGDKETGVTIMQMDEGLDTGDMLMTSTLTISDDENTTHLHDRLMTSGAATLIKALEAIAEGSIKPIAQNDDDACYAKKLTKEEAAINWNLTALQLDRKIRAFTPWPGSFVIQAGQKLKIIAKQFNSSDDNFAHQEAGTIISADEQGIRVAAKEGSLLITSLQLPGKKMTAVKELLNAYRDRFLPGQQFDR
ncbi:MAG: methionyl-tRNA formyltransferase [Gammaproteobacteria bacterium]|nr:MAG: methionyl-tRNA formyltransferase [Gammaproteobacteria bacterium]